MAKRSSVPRAIRGPNQQGWGGVLNPAVPVVLDQVDILNRAKCYSSKKLLRMLPVSAILLHRSQGCPDVGGGGRCPQPGTIPFWLIHRYGCRRELPHGSQDVQPWITRIARNRGQRPRGDSCAGQRRSGTCDDTEAEDGAVTVSWPRCKWPSPVPKQVTGVREGRQCQDTRRKWPGLTCTRSGSTSWTGTSPTGSSSSSLIDVCPFSSPDPSLSMP